MIPDMIHTPYIAPRISVMAPPPVTAERFVDELLSGLCMPDGGFVAHLAPTIRWCAIWIHRMCAMG